MPASAEPMPRAIWAQVDQFTHLFQHLRARQEGWEQTLIAECWDLIWTGELPDWAVTMAASGEPGTRWCPTLAPGLRARASSGS